MFFHIDKVIDITKYCKQNKETFEIFECQNSILELIGDFDPTSIVTIYSVLLSYYSGPCDIIVKPENSKEILYYYDLLNEW